MNRITEEQCSPVEGPNTADYESERNGRNKVFILEYERQYEQYNTQTLLHTPNAFYFGHQ